MPTNKKIDLYTRRRFAPRGCQVVWEYACSTVQSKTCKEAAAKFCQRYGLSSDQVKASFAR